MTRDVRLSALHRGIYGSGPARDEASEASPSASSSRPLVVAEGGVPKPPGSLRAFANPQDAASRSAIAMPRESTLTRTGQREGGIEKRIVKRKVCAIVDGR